VCFPVRRLAEAFRRNRPNWALASQLSSSAGDNPLGRMRRCTIRYALTPGDPARGVAANDVGHSNALPATRSAAPNH
jgi:hypothetical protein